MKDFREGKKEGGSANTGVELRIEISNVCYYYAF